MKKTGPWEKKPLHTPAPLFVISALALFAGGAWSQETSGSDTAEAGADQARTIERREHPHRVEIEKIQSGSLRVASTVSAVMEVNRFTVPDDPRIRIQLGRTEYQTIRITGPLPLPAEVITWFEGVRAGQNDRRSGSIILLEDDRRTEIRRMNFYESLPVQLDVELHESRWYLTVAVELIEFSAR